MADKYRFDQVARAEKYFVDTLLTHFLLSNEFAGLKILFQKVFGEAACSNPSQDFQDFEVVSELDPLRDGKVENSEIERQFRKFGRMAVPDLFLRWSKLCLVIEAKFFTYPSKEELETQLENERKAIESVKRFTIYESWDIRFAILTSVKTIPPENVFVLTWNDIIEMMKNGGASSSDLEYCRKIIDRANRSAMKKVDPSGRPVFETIKTLDGLLLQLPRLIEQRKVFIGFEGGPDKLASASELDLVNRRYKVSETKWNDNWLPMDRFLHRVFELRGLYDQSVIGGE
ncbi:MAG: hypothetical protein NTU41_08390 [Chloroflexi bacterium]|nr:hypothetical protein [Chloroflexota bacterium]